MHHKKQDCKLAVYIATWSIASDIKIVQSDWRQFCQSWWCAASSSANSWSTGELQLTSTVRKLVKLAYFEFYIIWLPCSVVLIAILHPDYFLLRYITVYIIFSVFLLPFYISVYQQMLVYNLAGQHFAIKQCIQLLTLF